MGARSFAAACLMAVLDAANPVIAQTPSAEHLRRTYGHIPPGPPCATEEFVVEFAAGDNRISESARTRFQADLRHPTSCNVDVVYLAAYDHAAIDAVRHLLLAEGLRPEAIKTIQLTVPVAPWPYEVEHVRVTFIYH